jgi:hypothetical protein
MVCTACEHSFCFICQLPWHGFHDEDGCPAYGDPAGGYDTKGYEVAARGLQMYTGRDGNGNCREVGAEEETSEPDMEQHDFIEYLQGMWMNHAEAPVHDGFQHQLLGQVVDAEEHDEDFAGETIGERLHRQARQAFLNQGPDAAHDANGEEDASDEEEDEDPQEEPELDEAGMEAVLEMELEYQQRLNELLHMDDADSDDSMEYASDEDQEEEPAEELDFDEIGGGAGHRVTASVQCRGASGHDVRR